MSESVLPGECSCGAVRFEAKPPSRFVAHCHCENCRRAHGAGVVTWAGFPEARFELVRGADDVADHVTETGATRSFCRRCGTPLTYRSPRWEGEVHVAVGALLEAPDRPPAAHVHADRAPGWCPITDSLPRYGGPDGTDPIAS